MQTEFVPEIYKRVPTLMLETERLWLKELTPDAITLMAPLFGDKDWMRFYGSTTAEQLQLDKNKHEAGLRTYNIDYKAFLLIDKASGGTIGRCGYHTWYFRHSRAEVGYGITDPAMLNKGYMTEALGAILKFGFDKMMLNRVEAFTAPWNEPSIKMLAKYGFQKEGVLREHYFKNGKIEDSVCFSLLKREYLAGKQSHN
jgi:ribosomal-protein-alanine N-acetyltransferase